jgi:dolichol-phosphate mannosyltransferase
MPTPRSLVAVACVAVGAVVVLDADLQDPPSLVREMIAKWRAGYEVVYAQRQRRDGETFFKRFTAKLYYRLLDYCTQVQIPRDTGDFALLDATVVRTLLELREHALFWRGLRKWTGFRQTAVIFDRPERVYGQTKYTLRKMVALAWDGLLSFSRLPLRLALYAGGVTLVATLICSVISVGRSLISAGPDDVPLFTLAVFYLGSVQLICLGIVGEYLNRIYDEVRNRPRWIVSATIGVPQERRQLPAAA